MRDIRSKVASIGLLVVTSFAATDWANAGSAVQKRIGADLAEGRPIVVQVIVALCDNVHGEQEGG